MPRPAKPRISPNQIAVSRTAGKSERRISSFIRLRGIALRNQAPPARPSSTAASFSGLVRLYRASRCLLIPVIPSRFSADHLALELETLQTSVVYRGTTSQCRRRSRLSLAGEGKLEAGDSAQVEPGAAGAADQPEHDLAAAGAAGDQARGVGVDAGLGDGAGGAAGGALAGRGGD